MNSTIPSRRLRPSAFFITLLVCSCFALPSARSQVQRQSPARTSDALQLLDALWVGGDRGLFQYRSSENVWSARGAETGLPERVTRLFADDDVLWIGSDHGVTRHDVRSNASTAFDTTRGIPAGRVRCFAAEPDYVWVGTERGAARYDKLIEQWQTIDARHGLTGTAVHAIAPREGRVLLATDSAVCEYDPRYEKWRTYRPETPEPIRDAFFAGTYLWLLLDSELLRFDAASNVFQRYTLAALGGAGAVRSIFIDGSSFWLQTADNLWQYDTQSDAVRPFLEITNLPDRDIQAVAVVSASSIWFATAGGLSHYENRTRGTNQGKSWTYLTRASGVPFQQCSALYASGQSIAAFTDTFIATYTTSDARWNTFPLPEVRGSGGRDLLQFDKTSGTMLRFGKDVTLSLGGSRASFLIRDAFTSRVETSKNFDLKARLDLGGGRTLTATYNDVDFSDVTYGVEYRGASDDILQIAQAGDLRVEQGARSILQPMGLFGAGARAAFGERTAKYRRPFVEITAAGGHQTTARTTEAFLGRNSARMSRVRTPWYQQRKYFRLDSLQNDVRVEPETFELFLDVDPATHERRGGTSDTVIAGRVGRWLRLLPIQDFTLDAERGIVRLRNEAGTRTLIARAVIDGRPADVVLNTAAHTAHEMRNVYALGVTGIVPSSLRCSDWMLAPEYGLDRDRDGLIDHEHIDYDEGVLQFPAARPFPADTYSDTASTGGRLMSFGFLTSTYSYALAHPRLVRGSELVLVDGLLTRAGEDYVLDYTSGALSFTRDGVVHDDSRIEVTYEYVSVDDERLYAQASVTVSPSDLLQGSLTGAAFTTGPNNVPTTVVHAMVDARVQSGGLDVRIAPEFSRSHTAWDTPGAPPSDGNALAVVLAASYGPARLNAAARRRDAGYVGNFKRWYSFGDLHQSASVQGEVDVFPQLRLFGSYRLRGGQEQWDPNDRQLDAGVKWFDPAYPSLTLRFTRGTEDAAFLPLQHMYTRAGSGQRSALRADVQYVLPETALRASGLSNASLISYLRYGEEENPSVPYSAWTTLPATFRFNNTYVRVTVAPRPMFTFTTYYRGDEHRASRFNGEWTRVQSLERLFLDGVMEHVPGLSLSGRYTGDVLQYGLPGAAGRTNSAVTRVLQLGTRFSPGTILASLSDFTVEVNVRRDTRRSTEDGSASAMFLSLFTGSDGREAGRNSTDFLETKLEWRPTPGFLSVTTGRFTGGKVEEGRWYFLDMRRDLIQRLDLHGDDAALYTLQFSVLDGRNPVSEFVRVAPFVFTEHRLHRTLLGRFTFGAGFETRTEGRRVQRATTLSPGLSLTFSVQNSGLLPRLELRYDLGLGYTDARSESRYGDTYVSRGMSNGFSLDVYPFGASYLRFMLNNSLTATSGSTVSITTATVQAVVQL